MKNQKIKAKIFQPIYGQLLVNETFIVNSKALQIDVKRLVKKNWKSQKTKKLRIDCKNSRQPFCKWKRKKKRINKQRVSLFYYKLMNALKATVWDTFTLFSHYLQFFKVGKFRTWAKYGRATLYVFCYVL